MRKIILRSASSFLLISLLNSGHGQTVSDSLINSNMRFELRDDTLYSDTGLKIFIGQKLVIGTPGGPAGRYRSIISNKAAIVPSIWGQDRRYEYAIENYVDSKKNKEKVKNSLIPGNVLVIERIGFSKTGKPHFYIVSLSSGTDDYNCDIKLALLVKELLLQ